MIFEMPIMLSSTVKHRVTALLEPINMSMSVPCMSQCRSSRQLLAHLNSDQQPEHKFRISVEECRNLFYKRKQWLAAKIGSHKTIGPWRYCSVIKVCVHKTLSSGLRQQEMELPCLLQLSSLVRHKHYELQWAEIGKPQSAEQSPVLVSCTGLLLVSYPSSCGESLPYQNRKKAHMLGALLAIK